MANPNDTADSNESIDASDLDSIDALLDEAELDALKEDEGVDELSEDDLPGLDEFSSEDEPQEIPSEIDNLLDDLDADLEEFSVSEKELDSDLDVKPVIKPKPPLAALNPSVDESESFLQKRAASGKSSKVTSELTVEEMGALKKLIVIFSSVLITLVIVSIGIGVWAAVSAGKNLDEETILMLEEIKASSQQSTMQAVTAENNLRNVDRKLDALSFQIEQLMSDLVEMEGHQPKQQGVGVDLATQAVVAKVRPQSEVKAPEKIVTRTLQENVEVNKKLTRVSSQVVTTQKRIAEVNRRIKSLQTQHNQLIKSIKNIEKEMVKKSLVVAKKLEKDKLEKEKQIKAEEDKKPQVSRYQLNPREGSYYW